METSNGSIDHSLFPITDSGSPAAKETHQGFLNEREAATARVNTAPPSGLTLCLATENCKRCPALHNLEQEASATCRGDTRTICWPPRQ